MGSTTEGVGRQYPRTFGACGVQSYSNNRGSIQALR